MKAVTVLTIVGLAISLQACSHEFGPPFGEAGKLTDHDRDSSTRDVGDAAVEQPNSADSQLPSGCGAPEDAGAPSPDTKAGEECTSSGAWLCVSPCGTVARIACFEKPGEVREIRCDSDNNCSCYVDDTFKARCQLLPNKEGRTGCHRAREALLTWGCCAP